MNPSRDTLEVRNKALKKGLRLAEKCLASISEDSFQILNEHTVDDNLDIYEKVYNINQQAHKALVPLREYCLKNDIQDS